MCQDKVGGVGRQGRGRDRVLGAKLELRDFIHTWLSASWEALRGGGGRSDQGLSG